MITRERIADEHLAAWLALEARASEAYGRFVYRDDDERARVTQLLVARNVGDFTRDDTTSFTQAGALLGILCAASGATLKKRRLKAAFALSSEPLDDATVRRMRLAGQTLGHVADDEFYLSRIAVAEAARGRRIGDVLLEEFLAQARSLGSKRLFLEVAPAASAAIALYQRHGFSQIDARTVVDAPSARELTYLHFARAVDA